MKRQYSVNDISMKAKIMILLMLALALTSCLNGELPDTEHRIVADREAIVLPAEFMAGQDTTVIIGVTSNMSWFVHLDDMDNPVDPSDIDAAIDWASIDVEEHENLTKVEDKTEISLRVHRNRTREVRNGVLNFYGDGVVMFSVPFTQEAAVYHLSAVPESAEALCTANEIAVSVVSNTAWTAEILPESTAECTLSTSEGIDSGELKVSFAENFKTVAKTAYVKFSAEGCEDQIVEITQSKALPYMILDEERTVTAIPADVDEVGIYLNTNLEGVTAELKEGGQLTDAVIEKVSDKEFRLKFTPDGTDPLTFKKSTVVVSAAGVDDMELEFRQNGRLYFDFKVADNISPAMPTKTSDEYSSHILTVGENVYSFGFKAFFHRSGNVLLFQKGGYIQLPAIEGLTLKKIKFTFRDHSSTNRYPRLTIKGTGEDSDTLYSEKDIKVELTTNVNHYTDFLLEVGTETNAPQPGVSYRICQNSKYVCQVRYLELQYE